MVSRTQFEDVQEFARLFVLADELAGSSFLITGATGLIGSSLIRCLLALDKGIRILAPVRNIKKAEAMFDDLFTCVEWIECDLESYDYCQVGKVDYIIHCAAPTSSNFFVDCPVETNRFIYGATLSLLTYSLRQGIRGFVYLSSIEVYGSGTPNNSLVKEDMQGFWDPMNVRSSYPVAKRAVENLCCAYAVEFGVPVKVARLTQTTGAGLSKDDNRIIAQFARLAAKGEDIILHTNGESARPYCYTIDCVTALLYILLRGKNGEAYNVANENTYISARGMAEFLRDNFNSAIDVRIELNDDMPYAPDAKLNLSTEKLQALGWQPNYNLKQIFERLIDYFSE